MKKNQLFAVAIILFLITYGCKDVQPTAPLPTATAVNVEATIAAVLTHAANVNAASTMAAQGTQTAVAYLYTATMTRTCTPSPDLTAAAAVIGTAVADIHASETEAVILSRTPTFTATPTVTQTHTVTDTFTHTHTHTITMTITDTATRTMTLTSTMTFTNTATFTSTNTPIPFSAFVTVPGGTYTQADDSGTNSFVHTVSSFKIAGYEVTYDLWYAVYQWALVNGYTFQNAGMEGSAGTIGAAPTSAKFHPVTTICWRDMIVWCNAYSQMSLLAPVYCVDAGFTTPVKDSLSGAYGSSIDTTPGSFDNPFVNWNADGYRLPTEGEWQYAASYIDGVSWTPYNYASGAAADHTDAGATGAAAWYQANSGSITHDVGGRAANALGIYDMSGNAWEFCWDWHASYPADSTDYKGPATGTVRIGKGGSYYDPAVTEIMGVRGADNPYATLYYYYSYGFRVAKKN